MVYAKVFKKERIYIKAFKEKKICIKVFGKVVNFKSLIKSLNIIILKSSISYINGPPLSDEKRGRLAVKSLKGIVLTTLRIFF